MIHEGSREVPAAVAGFMFALGPGHNIPFAGGTPGVPKQLAIMALVTAVSAVVLVEAHARWAASPGERAPEEEREPLGVRLS